MSEKDDYEKYHCPLVYKQILVYKNKNNLRKMTLFIFKQQRTKEERWTPEEHKKFHIGYCERKGYMIIHTK